MRNPGHRAALSMKASKGARVLASERNLISSVCHSSSMLESVLKLKSLNAFDSSDIKELSTINYSSEPNNYKIIKMKTPQFSLCFRLLVYFSIMGEPGRIGPWNVSSPNYNLSNRLKQFLANQTKTSFNLT